MLSRKKYLTAGLAMLLAAASGHLMQRNNGLGDRLASEEFKRRPEVQVPAPPAPVTASAGLAIATPAEPPAQAAPKTVAPVMAETAPEPEVIVPVASERVMAEVDTDTDAPIAEEKLSPDLIVAEAVENARGAEPVPVPVPIAEVTRSSVVTSMPGANLLTETPFEPVEANPVRVAAADIVAAAETEAREEDAPLVGAAKPGCKIGFTATSAPAAMVDLTVEAHCHAKERIEFEHAGLRFTEETDETGLVRVSVPALIETARFVATFEDGGTAVAEIFMPTAADYLRVALQWTGNEGFQLHAMEDKAVFGGEGHVSSLSPESPARAKDGKGGFLTVLGSVLEGNLADVYSYPRALAATQMAPEISIEAEITEANCGREITGNFLANDPLGRDTQLTDVTMVVPDCEARGEFLVLKNPVQDLTIAVN